MARKYVHPDCDGSVFCTVEGHVQHVSIGANTRHSHIPLTVGQSRTLYERRVARRAAEEAES